MSYRTRENQLPFVHGFLLGMATMLALLVLTFAAYRYGVLV